MSEALLAAAERCLEQKPYARITLREIATIAGVNQAMVNYYFVSKTGLFLALIETVFKRQTAQIRALEKRLNEAPDSITREFVDAIRSGFYRHPAVLHFILRESQDPDSVFWALFKKRVAATNVMAIRRFIAAAAERGIYRRDVDPRLLTLLVYQLAFRTLTTPNLKQSYACDVQELFSDAWFALLEDALERLLRP